MPSIRTWRLRICIFKTQRVFNAIEPKQIEKVDFKDSYGINETPRNLFIKYLLDLKMTQALASSNGRFEKSTRFSGGSTTWRAC